MKCKAMKHHEALTKNHEHEGATLQNYENIGRLKENHGMS